MFALDTNTLIYFFKGLGRVKSHLLNQAPRDIVIPAIVVYEIEFGIANSTQGNKRRAEWHSFLEQCRILDFGVKEALAAAKLRHELESRGEPIGPIDVLIAGTALASELTIVTHNTREFRKVPKLKLVDWFY